MPKNCSAVDYKAPRDWARQMRRRAVELTGEWVQLYEQHFEDTQSREGDDAEGHDEDYPPSAKSNSPHKRQVRIHRLKLQQVDTDPPGGTSASHVCYIQM